MSNFFLNQVWPLIMSATDKSVLVALADAARGPDDRQAPSQAWLPMKGRNGKVGLVERTCLTDRAIQKAVRRLVEAGHISRTEIPGKGVIYFLHPRTTFAPNPVRPDSSSATPEPASDKPSITPKEEKKDSAEGVNSPLPDWIPAVPWEAFVKMRHAIPHTPFTKFAEQETIRKLDELRRQGHDIGKILTTCAVRSYREVYEPGPHATPTQKKLEENWTAERKASYRASLNAREGGIGGPPATRSSGGPRSIGNLIQRSGLSRPAFGRGKPIEP